MKPWEPRLAFIMGMSRAGTTWMSTCLGRHPDIAAFGECMYWGKKYIQPSRDGAYTRDQCNQILTRLKDKGILRHGTLSLRNVTAANLSEVLDEAVEGIEFPVNPGELFKCICRRIAQKEEKTWVIEKTPHHIHWIDRINAALPDSKFIVTYREPYSFMLSYKHQPDRQKLSSKKEKTMRGLYHPLGCALVWRGYARSVDHVMKKYPKSACLAPFRDIKEQPENVLEKIQLFLGVQPCKELNTAEPNTSFPDRKRPSLSSDDIFWMNLLSYKEIRALGFETRQTDYEWFKIVRSFLRIPLWVFHVTWNMRLEVEGGLFAFLKSWTKIKPIGQ